MSVKFPDHILKNVYKFMDQNELIERRTINNSNLEECINSL